MTHETDLTLAQAIVNDGFDAHHEVLIDLLDRALRSDVAGTLITVVSDRAAPLVVRHRALGRILTQMAARSPIDDDAQIDPLSFAEPTQAPHQGSDPPTALDFDLAFHRLLQAWNRHQHLRDTDTSIAELVMSRTELDDARLAMAQVQPAGIRSQPAGTDARPFRPDIIEATSHFVAHGQTVIDRRDVEPCQTSTTGDRHEGEIPDHVDSTVGQRI